MRTVSRRKFLRMSTLVTASTVAGACVQPVTPAAEVPPASIAQPTAAPGVVPTVPTSGVTGPAVAATLAPGTVFSEAPVLAERVAAGELPPVEERLPVNPCVWPVFESIGKYGGTMRRSHGGTSDRQGPLKLTRRRLNWFNPDLSVRPDLAESWAINEDASEWTFRLRAGGKWSDGAPFTARDFVYYYEDFLLHTDLTPAISSDWKAGSGDAEAVFELDTPDDYTVIFRFPAPKPFFHYTMGNRTPFAPAHYMETLHPQYADQAELDTAAKAAGFETWAQQYLDKDNYDFNPERPSVDTWVPTNSIAEELFVMERNPFFMGIDPEGNQLPYIDKVTHRLRANSEVFAMWIINGEIDFQGRSIPDYTLMKEGEATGNYHVVRGYGQTHYGLNPNQACKSPLVREFFQTRECRIAMSLAMNRQEINDLVYDGELTPRQYSPTEGSPQFYPKASNVYLDYDPDEANRLLDLAGYTAKDADGYRLWKDGSSPVSFIMEGYTGGSWEDESVMWIKYLADVGIKATLKTVERSLFTEHYGANDVECGVWGGGSAHTPIIEPEIFLGIQDDRPWAGAWGIWKNNPNDPNAEEPPQDHWIRDIWRIWDQVAVELDDTKRNELFFQILDIWAEELPMVTTLGMDRRSIIMKNDMRNYTGEGMPFWGTVDDAMDAPTLFYVNPEEYVR